MRRRRGQSLHSDSLPHSSIQTFRYMHGPLGARLLALRIAPASILATELLRQRTELCISSSRALCIMTRARVSGRKREEKGEAKDGKMIGQLLALSNTAHWEHIAFGLISLLWISCCYGSASLASTEMELAPEDFRSLKLLWDDYDKSIDPENVREDL